MRTLKLKDAGKEVQELQKLLQKQGYNAPQNRTFDEATKASVIAFQKANGQDADGIVGYKKLGNPAVGWSYSRRAFV